MSLLNLGEDPWLHEYDSSEKLHQNIMEQLSQRQHLQRTSDKYANLSATIRLRLKQYNNEVGQLVQKLEVSTKAGNITAAEAERRSRQVEVLHSKSLYMKQLFDEQVIGKMREDRDKLMGQPGRSGWGDDSTYRDIDASSASIGQLREHQRQMLGEQEQGLDTLAQIISRQKTIASTISNEVDLHNEILDDLGDHIDRTDTRVRDETQHVTIVENKDKTCAYWVIIILLFISIIIVAAI